MPKVSQTTQKQLHAEKAIWNDRVSHPLQTWEWGQFRQAMGIDVTRLHNWQITFHRIPYTPWTVGYFPKGPKPTLAMISQLMNLGRQKNAVVIQLEPDVVAGKNALDKTLPLIPSHRPLFTKYTFILDLAKSEKTLLASMHQKTRYNLRVAQKHHVEVKEDNSDQAFSEYLRLNEETTGRQGFYAHNAHYHQTMWNIMKKSGMAHLFTASFEGKTLAAWIIFAFGKTLYYPYGTSSRKHREVMAPTLLLWEIARWGKQNGYRSFDLWGALGPNPDAKDPWFGFHRFKQGFNPMLTQYIGSFDLIIHPILYKLYTIADTIRWIVLKRKAGGS